MSAIGDGDSPLIITTTASTASSSSTTQQEPSIGDPPPPPPAPAPVRPVILETAKETYLLSPSVLTVQGRLVRVYDIALVLETEVVVEDQEDQVPPVEKVDAETKVVDAEAPSSKTKDALVPVKDGSTPSTTVSSIADGASEPKPKSGSSSSPVPRPSPPAIDDVAAVETPALAPPSSPPPSEDQNLDADSSLVTPNKPTLASSNNTTTTTTTMLIDDEMMLIEENNVKPQFAAVQVLQRGLSVEMFRFAEDGVYVLDGTAVSASAGANDGMETEWAISVRNWKWAPRGPGLRERV
jgi:hypothetical protein